ncbi:MAG: GGDEF domain-containing protein [Gallionella sp.]
MIHSPEILEVLETSPLLHGIPRDLLDQHLAGLKLLQIRKGNVLLAAGQANNTIYFIYSGRLNVQSRENDVEPFAILGVGECVGEMSMLGDAPASAYVVAATDCELLSITHADMWGLINTSHAAAHNLLNILTRRIRSTNQVAADSREKQQGFAAESMIDEQTGLYNQHWTHGKFARLLHRAVMNNKPSCMLMLEMDSLANFVRKHGQLGGEQAMRNIADTLMLCLRPEDQAGRHSGGKFAIFLPDTTVDDARTVAERIMEAVSLSQVVLPSGDALPNIRVSIGICQAGLNESLDSLFTRSDAALQQAKRDGENAIQSSP